MTEPRFFFEPEDDDDEYQCAWSEDCEDEASYRYDRAASDARFCVAHLELARAELRERPGTFDTTETA